ncbi:MAG TPA: MarR family transcriptional regulator [Firmicutes bacterium]|jgi:MarR family transcriptional regulator, organic hydroperoxide resistance regulator|nr:MarR family transcriptional regulator [Bacillota bacterium]
MDQENSDSLYTVFSQVIRFHYYRMHLLFEKFGVYPGQHRLFFILGKQEGLSQRELAERLHIKAATVTVMLNRMAKANFIERRPDADDQRVTRVYLTGQGQNILIQVKESLRTIETECFTNFTPEEQILLRRLLMQIRKNLMNACENPGNQHSNNR